MSLFGHLFDHRSEQENPVLPAAIERAVSAVEPLLMHMHGYPDSYRKPVGAALEYAHHLADTLPGPVTVDRESYAMDAFIHALFPSVDLIRDALCASYALRDYREEFPASNELYALMGMRRNEKSVMGMELTGQTIQRDVVQKAVYFTSHTIAYPASTEQQSREQIAMSFFDSLVGRVKQRIERRKQAKQAQMLKRDMLMAQLHTANTRDRPALEKQLAGQIASLQSAVGSLDLSNDVADFEAVLLHPEEYLRLHQTRIVLDSMGIRRTADEAGGGKAILFNDLIGFDRRDWTVTMVRCGRLQSESFAAKLDKAYRRLVI